MRDHVVIIGYGRVGQHLVKVLGHLGIARLVVEYDIGRVTELECQGVPTLYGDAANSDILSRVHLKESRAVVVTLPDEASEETLFLVLEVKRLDALSNLSILRYGSALLHRIHSLACYHMRWESHQDSRPSHEHCLLGTDAFPLKMRRTEVLEFLAAVGGIILIDLVLSGDNALVIGAAAAGLPRRQRWYAIALGGGGAIVLRIAFVIIASLLLRLPLLQAIGGLLLLLIAVRLLMDRSSPIHEQSTEHLGPPQEGERGAAAATKGFRAALLTILASDVTMSLDNVLAIGALAAGNLPLLAAGLLLSILLLLVGSALVAELVGRLPWLLDVAALVLAWTAANMILDDIRLGPVLAHVPWIHIVLPAIAFAVVIAADILLRLRTYQRASKKLIA